ncbi:A repeated domain in UCH-protein-domain-containing protein [Suillus placidus]|uniref:A repeated domain in UCH-protein-domain-containing protein n=1 Tax=Suillus placidus TaxID=48579 RepID=A0A9P6ZK51_9AGAM|nr:A repeated domain in UCH-protein-domain-containing protein [Suillus placidus]KAG1770116.1 A repeated domain in UCH-protein-domain-containing protein [Suillus placidus]
MDPSRAYSVLEISVDVDDELVLAVFMLRVEEQPHQSDKRREALRTIAEVRDSSRLRHFLEEGKDRMYLLGFILINYLTAAV